MLFDTCCIFRVLHLMSTTIVVVKQVIDKRKEQVVHANTTIFWRDIIIFEVTQWFNVLQGVEFVKVSIIEMRATLKNKSLLVYQFGFPTQLQFFR